MFYYTYQELYRLVKEYNKKHNTNININELVDPNFTYIKKLGYLDKSMFGKYNPKVIYEDANFYGINKPPFWIVNVTGKYTAESDVHKNMDKYLLQVWLYKNLDYPLRDSIKHGYGICNRLDINTSGIVIVAKNEKNYHYLRKEISSHENTRKKYFAVVSGLVKDQGIIQTDIECIRKGTSKCYNVPKGQHSKTQFFPITYLKDKDGNDYTLLDIRIFTGRTHQIRVHMKMLNTYIVGDNMYSTDEDSYMHDINLVQRIFLHAYYYTFLNMDGKRIEIFAPLADDLLESMEENFTINDEVIKKEDLMDVLRNPSSLVVKEDK